MNFEGCLIPDDLERLTKRSGFKRNLAAYEEAKLKGYVVFHYRNWDLANAYYHWCEIIGKPYLRVQLYKKYAHVSLDLISFRDRFLQYSLTDEGIKQVTILNESEYNLIKSSALYPITRKQFYCSGIMAEFERLPLDRVDAYLKTLLEIMKNHVECV
jgi:hypothetical protein